MRLLISIYLHIRILQNQYHWYQLRNRHYIHITLLLVLQTYFIISIILQPVCNNNKKTDEHLIYRYSSVFLFPSRSVMSRYFVRNYILLFTAMTTVPAPIISSAYNTTISEESPVFGLFSTVTFSSLKSAGIFSEDIFSLLITTT